ncbi:hypothetical protein [Paenibacillus sp. UNC451MF]|uniref:hypothetical protein n=1 Tax=Paenibacillus sp. UNC451MF TaxID=1449063 RepID=UPI00048BE2D9|nr:hypothetical protein [Paenibacillus sp. UNC451MF]
MSRSIETIRLLEEALGIAEHGGVDPTAAVNMLTSTLFTAPSYQSYGKMIAENSASISQAKFRRKMSASCCRRRKMHKFQPRFPVCCLICWRTEIGAEHKAKVHFKENGILIQSLVA